MTPESLVQDTHTLLSLPDVAFRVNELIDQPDTRPSDLAEVILCDPGLSARLLRLINSAYYGLSKPVDTVSQAIYFIGQRELRDLVFATSTVNLFKGLPPEQVNMEMFWFHSIACGIAARELARRCRLPEGERLFLAGLLHSVGKLVFYSQCPDQYRQVLQQVEREAVDTVVAERQVFGFTYADVSAELLKSWRFPERLWVAVAHHLEPAQAPNYWLEAVIVHASVYVANSLQPSVNVAPLTMGSPDILAALADMLALSPDSLAALPAEINLQVIEVFEIIQPGATLIY
ncbi:MAG: HDOD domain-containing protein [Candidatus Competibacteraceae bacterium]|nr:HDOD domain-containing protein [Candidatus Competibacteraceae bacterium]HRY15440.1 HDOD domain-containing protein [Candidatus Competibacteraceae bacterium]